MSAENHIHRASLIAPLQRRIVGTKHNQLHGSDSDPSSGRTFEAKIEADEKLVAKLMAAAASTLACLPSGTMTVPVGLRSNWPEMQRKSRFIIEKTRMTSRAVPTPQAIDSMTYCLDLLWTLTPVQRQLIWARACRIPWAMLVERLKRSRTALNRDHHQALMILARHHGNNDARPVRA